MVENIVKRKKERKKTNVATGRKKVNSRTAHSHYGCAYSNSWF